MHEKRPIQLARSVYENGVVDGRIAKVSNVRPSRRLRTSKDEYAQGHRAVYFHNATQTFRNNAAMLAFARKSLELLSATAVRFDEPDTESKGIKAEREGDYLLLSFGDRKVRLSAHCIGNVPPEPFLLIEDVSVADCPRVIERINLDAETYRTDWTRGDGESFSIEEEVDRGALLMQIANGAWRFDLWAADR